MSKEMMIPKTTQIMDNRKKLNEAIYSYLQVAKANCNKCNICGGDLMIQSAYGGYHLRICCENYKKNQPELHGNLADNQDKRRFTDWMSGEDNLKDAIKQWNELNS